MSRIVYMIRAKIACVCWHGTRALSGFGGRGLTVVTGMGKRGFPGRAAGFIMALMDRATIRREEAQLPENRAQIHKNTDFLPGLLRILVEF